MLKRNVRGGQPSPYARLPFHGLRAAQLISSITVSSIMSYFLHFLRIEKFPTPWTFVVLLSVSLATIVILTFTIILYNFTFLSPRFNLVLNGSISLIWAMAFAMLCWSISASNVLAKACTSSIWHTDTAAGVCRSYKALWSMTLVATIATLAALSLDFITWKKTHKRGQYGLPEDVKASQKLQDLSNSKATEGRYEPTRGQEIEVMNTGALTPGLLEHEPDIGYHSRYGAEPVHPHGPLDGETRGAGYNGGFYDTR